LPWIVLAFTVPMVMTPVMKYLWLQMGVGNANFLFFQGLVMWVAYALFMLEYISSFIKFNKEKLLEMNEEEKK
jgi:hypothetical protein